MNANDLIDSYVADVARLLGRKQRDDVAFELRALLVEELDAKARRRAGRRTRRWRWSCWPASAVRPRSPPATDRLWS